MNRLINPYRLKLLLGVSINGPLHGSWLRGVSCKKLTATNGCASIAGHFNGHAEASLKVEAMRSASPDAACPGLLRKPLDATIGRLIAP